MDLGNETKVLKKIKITRKTFIQTEQPKKFERHFLFFHKPETPEKLLIITPTKIGV